MKWLLVLIVIYANHSIEVEKIEIETLRLCKLAKLVMVTDTATADGVLVYHSCLQVLE